MAGSKLIIWSCPAASVMTNTFAQWWTAWRAPTAAAQARRLAYGHLAFKMACTGLLLLVWIMAWVWSTALDAGLGQWLRERQTAAAESVVVGTVACAAAAWVWWWRGWGLQRAGWMFWASTMVVTIFLYWTSALRTDMTEPARDATRDADPCAQWLQWFWPLACVPLGALFVWWLGSGIHWWQQYQTPTFVLGLGPGLVGMSVNWAVEALIFFAVWMTLLYRLHRVTAPPTRSFPWLENLMNVSVTYGLLLLTVTTTQAAGFGAGPQAGSLARSESDSPLPPSSSSHEAWSETSAKSPS